MDWKFILALIFGPRRSVWRRVAIHARDKYHQEILAQRSENARLRCALDLSGIPAQAKLDDKAPPLKTTVAGAREIMEAINAETT